MEKRKTHDTVREEAAHGLRAEHAKKVMPESDMLEETSNIFKMLAEPSRLKIVLALLEGEMCVYHIVNAVGGKQSAVSHQLRILRDSHIIKSRRDGKNILYSLADEHVAKIIEMSREHLSC